MPHLDRLRASISVRLLPHQYLTLIHPQWGELLYTLNNSSYTHLLYIISNHSYAKFEFFCQRTLSCAHSDCHLSKKVTVESRCGNLQSLVQGLWSSGSFFQSLCSWWLWALGSCLGKQHVREQLMRVSVGPAFEEKTIEGGDRLLCNWIQEWRNV